MYYECCLFCFNVVAGFGMAQGKSKKGLIAAKKRTLKVLSNITRPTTGISLPVASYRHTQVNDFPVCI